MNRMVKVIVWCLLVVLSVSVVGCKTMHGAGEDIEDLGEGVQNVTD